MNAFNLTTEATTNLNLPIKLHKQRIWHNGEFHRKRRRSWPHEYWHLWLWNSTHQLLDDVEHGRGDVNASSYAAFAWSYVPDRADYSSPVPTSDPLNRYSWEQSRHDNFNTGFSNVPTSISNDTVFGLDLTMARSTQRWSSDPTRTSMWSLKASTIGHLFL